MASNIPIVNQFAWVSFVLQIIVIIIIVSLMNLLKVENTVLWSSITYLLLSFILRTQIPKDQRKGIKLLSQGHFPEAIPYFQKSYDFFKKHNWLDKYRYLTLLSSSKMTYKEIALNNIAFCYGQTGDIEKSKEYYEKTLREFPDNSLAITALRFIQSFEKQEHHKDSIP